MKEQKIEALLKSNRQKILSYIQKHVRQKDVAEDLVQDALIKIYLNRRAIDENRNPTAWIYKIARNTVIDHYRSNHFHDQLNEDFPSMRASPEGQNSAELANCLRGMVKGLPKKYRDAFSSATLEGESTKHIAARLMLSVSGIKSRIQRGRNILVRRLYGCCPAAFKIGRLPFNLQQECKKDHIYSNNVC